MFRFVDSWPYQYDLIVFGIAVAVIICAWRRKDMNIGSTMVRKGVVDTDLYQMEKKMPVWKLVAGSVLVALGLLLGAVAIAVFA